MQLCSSFSNISPGTKFAGHVTPPEVFWEKTNHGLITELDAGMTLSSMQYIDEGPLRNVNWCGQFSSLTASG